MKTKHTLLALSSILATALPSQAANVLLLSDNFNAGSNNTNQNLNLPGRQDGTLEASGGAAPTGSTWTEVLGTANAISSNQLSLANGASTALVRNNADLEASLTTIDLVAVSGFIMDFKFDYNGGAGFISSYLTTHTGDERVTSRFGVAVLSGGGLEIQGNSRVDLSNATMTSLVSGWNVTNLNSFSLNATRTTATTGVYDVFVNGIEVYSNQPYTFGTGGDNGEVNFEVIASGGNNGLYDDFSIMTVPEPRAALLGGLGMLALLRRRRN